MNRQRHGGRQAILEAAMRLFAEKGYAATSTREICKAARITKPVLYYHFRSKEHLYQELMIDCFGQHQKMLLRASQAAGGFRERLVRVMEEELKSAREEPLRVQFLIRMIFSPERRRPQFNAVARMEANRAFLADVFRKGVASGEVLGKPAELATIMMGMSLITILENLFTGKPTLTRRNAERLVGVLLDGCGERVKK
ncbi:MAG: TetR/AcrR family transcriptional regulator [Acidobacteria bacterium]|nr:TetR/AcrR family transcriptional regulator [Acidobacteriota bacterium]